MTRRRQTGLLVAITVLGLTISACGGAVSSTSTELTTTTTTSDSATTTLASTTTSLATTTTKSKTPLERLLNLGYTLSDEYVVETVIRDIDSGTGGLAVASDGTLYQGDFGEPGNPGNAVYRISPDGLVEIFATSDEMARLTMTTFGPDGTLYQSSYGSDKVFAIGEDGNVELLAEGISGPTGIVALDDGTIFVEAYDSGILHKIEPDGTVVDWVRHSDFSGINGLTIGPDGTLYAVNHRDGGLFAIDQEGTVTNLHEFPWKTSHVAYLDGGLFVTSRGAFVVYRYDLESGDVEIVAGNAEPGDMDGRGGEASFGRPNAITVGPDGALYFNHADGDSNYPLHIRRIVYQP